MATIKKCGISIFLLFAFVLSGCSFLGYKKACPEKGVWYCEELKMTLMFGTRTVHINGQYLSNHGEYVGIDGSIVHFGIASEYGCKDFSLWYVSGPDFNHDFFLGECDYWDEDKMLVTEWLDNERTEKGKSYLFVRVDK